VFPRQQHNLEASTGALGFWGRVGLSEEMRRAVGTILEAGFQMESEAFKTLVEKVEKTRSDPSSTRS